MAASSKNYTKTKTLAAIQGSGGIISTISKRLGCTWRTAQKLTQQWPEAQEAYRDEKEQLIDLAETTLLQAIKGGDMSAAKWYLSTIGKERGYSERQEITGADGSAIQAEIVWRKPDAD